MNWELFGIVLIWLVTIYSTLVALLHIAIIWEHNTNILTKAKLQGKASLATRGQIDLLLAVIGWVFLGVYYFG